jgi:hypothetical protein
MEHLFVPDQKTKRLVINGYKLRKLNLASTAPGLLFSGLVSDARNKETLVSSWHWPFVQSFARTGLCRRNLLTRQAIGDKGADITGSFAASPRSCRPAMI